MAKQVLQQPFLGFFGWLMSSNMAHMGRKEKSGAVMRYIADDFGLTNIETIERVQRKIEGCVPATLS